MENKKQYEEIEAEAIVFDSNDVILTSKGLYDPDPNNEYELPEIP